MRNRRRQNYPEIPFFLENVARKQTRDNAHKRSADRDDDIYGIDLRREKIADDIGCRTDDTADDRPEHYARQKYGQIFKGDPEKSAAEIQEALAENSDDHAHCGQHCRHDHDLECAEKSDFVLVFLHKKSPFLTA